MLNICLDIYYEKQYATALAILHVFLAAGSQIGPLIAGYLIEARGWQWFFKLTSILVGINLFLTIFFLPETSYRHNFTDGVSAGEVADQESGKDQDIRTVEEMPEGRFAQSSYDLNEPYAGSFVSLLLSASDMDYGN